jgi:Na+-driven multidrug efflux pump
MIFLVGVWGTTAVASYGVTVRIMSFVIIPTVGVAMAVSALVGQSFGALEIKRAEKIAEISAGVVFILLTLLGVLFFVFARNLISLFIPADTAVISKGTLFLKITSLTFGFIGLQIVLSGVFRGSGNTFTAMFLTVLNFFVFRVIFGFILSKFTSLGEKGIWIVFPASNLIGGLCSFFWFLRGTWKRKKITKDFSAVLEREVPQI